MQYLIQPGQLWRSLHTRRVYRVLAIEALGVKVEPISVTFPASAVYLCPCMFAPPQMELEEVAVADDFDAYHSRLTDRED
jgi:hypothetical protein